MSIFENEMFQWLNGGTLVPEENGFAIIAPPHSDFFQDPTGGNGTRSNAPFYYTEITGDFTLRATVWHDFTAAGDACTWQWTRPPFGPRPVLSRPISAPIRR